MMNRLENAARQALEALEYVLKPTADFDEAVCQKLHDTAITALREALAEQQAAEPAKQCATPEQCKNTFCAPPCPGCKTAPTQQAAEPVSMPALVGVLATLPAQIKEAVEAYGAACARVALLATHSAPVQQAAEPVGQKPYAYEYGVDNGDGTYSIQIDRGSLIHTGVQYEYCAPRNPHPEHPVKPLYTHPAPPQQPLTDEQKAVLRECRKKAMKWTAQAGIPECGAFGGMAQDLDWLCGQLGITGSKT